MEGHGISFLGIYISFFSYLENLSSRFLLYVIYIYLYISHRNSWQITWPIPGPSYIINKENTADVIENKYRSYYLIRQQVSCLTSGVSPRKSGEEY
jgi:hypothetical protein